MNEFNSQNNYQKEFSNKFFKTTKQINSPPKDSWLTFMSIIFLLLGLGFLVGSVKVAFDKYQFSQIASIASGTVIDLVPVKTRDRETRRTQTTYAALVQFTAQNGKTYKFRTTSSSNPPSYRRLEQVSVLYEAANPEFAFIKDWHFYSLPIFLGIFGLAFTGAGLIVMWLKASIKNEQAS